MNMVSIGQRLRLGIGEFRNFYLQFCGLASYVSSVLLIWNFSKLLRFLLAHKYSNSLFSFSVCLEKWDYSVFPRLLGWVSLGWLFTKLRNQYSEKFFDAFYKNTCFKLVLYPVYLQITVCWVCTVFWSSFRAKVIRCTVMHVWCPS